MYDSSYGIKKNVFLIKLMKFLSMPLFADFYQEKLLDFLKCLLKWAYDFFSCCYGELDFPGGSDGKESACNAGDLGLIPGLARSSGKGNGTPLQVLLPGKSHGRRSLVGCSPWGCKELDTTERLHFHFSLSCIGEGNGNPLQCSCLENLRDGGAWWAAVYGISQSWTRLKCLSSSK